MLDLTAFIKTIGYAGIFAVVFAESGLFLGFFLPGDSLLFTAGFLASQRLLDIAPLIVVVTVGAILGDSFGYAFGRKVGPRIFKKEDSFFFHRDHLERAKAFYARHGRKTIVLARFFPIVRTFAPILAGVGGMHYPTFLAWNVLGGVLWSVIFTALGYFVGNVIPDAERYILFIVIVIVIASVLPALKSFFYKKTPSS